MDADNLERAIDSSGSGKEEKEEPKTPEISEEQEIGFHKGVLNTLASERNELVKMIRNVEAIMQAHIKRLKEMGVELK